VSPLTLHRMGHMVCDMHHKLPFFFCSFEPTSWADQHEGKTMSNRLLGANELLDRSARIVMETAKELEREKVSVLRPVPIPFLRL
jgi:hypothetical protein